MAVKSVTLVKELAVAGDLWYTINDVVLPTSSTEGGETLTLQALGFGPEAVFVTASAEVQEVGGETNIVHVAYNGTKLIPFDETPAIVAKEKDLDAVKVRLTTYCSSP